ncbi:MAG: DUF6350 family protein [Candidatus Nanopelagicales bacterium]
MGYRPLEERRISARANAAGDRPPSREAHESTPTGGRRRAWTRVARGKADAAVANLSAPVAGALAAAWGAFATLMSIGLLMIAIWIFGAGEGSAMGALQSAGNTWLIAHLVPISNSGTLITLLPLGLVVIPGFLLWRAGIWAARRSGACYWREVRSTVFMATAVYASIAMLVAGVSGTSTASVSPILAIIICGIFAFVVFGGAAFYEAGLWPRAVARIAQPVRFRIRVAVIVSLVILAGSAGLIALGLILNWSDATGAQELLGVGLMGSIGLLIVTLAYWPNALVWGASYISGVGYNVGGGGMVTPFSAEVGAIPAFPLLAATPTFAAWYTWLVLLIPVIGGVVGAFYARKLRGLGPSERFAWSGPDFAWICGIVAATMIFFSFFARGSLGAERMAGLGPGILAPGVALGILTLFGLLLGGAVVRFTAARGRHKGTVDLTDTVVDLQDES